MNANEWRDRQERTKSKILIQSSKGITHFILHGLAYDILIQAFLAALQSWLIGLFSQLGHELVNLIDENKEGNHYTAQNERQL